jgi:hypothetical protein
MENQEITVADLNLIKNIIDLASSRGAFRAGELKEIGEVYNKLTAFLDAVIAQAQEQEASASDTGETKGDRKSVV